MSKKFGFWSIVLLGINLVMGSGIFLLPGKVMDIVGPGSIFVYLGVTLMVLALTMCFAECASKFSCYGAAYIYSKRAFGLFVGFEVGIMSWVARTIAWAVMAVGFVTALSAVWPPALVEPFKTAIILFILIGLGIINIVGIQPTKILNNLVTIGKIVPIIFFIIIGVAYININNFTPMFPHGLHSDSFGTACLVVFYAFAGFESIAIASEDMENPQKTLPIAILVAMCFIACIYFLIQTVAISTLGSNLATSVAPVADAAETFSGPVGKWLVTIGSLISIGGINVASSFVAPRVGAALAQDGLLPRFMAEINSYGTPHWAIIITVVLAIPIALSGTFTYLAAIAVISRLAQYVPTCLAVIVLRKKYPSTEDSFKVPFGPIIPLFATASSIWLLYNASQEQLLLGLSALGVGVPLYFIMKYTYSPSRLAKITTSR
jgi:amino acid transporter